MAQFVEVPHDRLEAQVLQALLEEFASRDGTDYGVQEYTLEQKVGQLRRQLQSSELQILYDADCEEWDLVDSESAGALLEN
jgi:uncharacterized protein YheU (UPF0270 family)